jgi:poly-gamma-glutamate synthesis protein (capsule biosynthesis protein)
LQGIERYGKGVIVYSLGNFIFGGNSRSSYDTGLFEIRLGSGVPAYRFVPVAVEQWKARILTGSEAERVLRIVRERSAPLRHSMFTSNGQQKESP